MKFHNIAEDILGSRLKIAALKILLCYPSKKFSGRELARLLNASPSAVLEILELFRDYGLVYKARIGKTAEWSANKHHLLAAELSSLLKLDEAAQNLLRQKIKAALSKNRNIIRAVLFGSVAKGEERAESDIDLFIAVKGRSHKKDITPIIERLNESFISFFGNSVAAIVYSSDELKSKEHLSLVKHIKEEGEAIIDRGQD